MNRKVEHVLGARQSRRHHCHWPGCEQQVPPARWGCRAHWFRIPKHLRDAIWRAYSPGQEESGHVSEFYVKAAREVQEWIRTQAT